VGGACGTHERGEKSVEVLGGKPKEKIPLGKPVRRWGDGIRMDLGRFAGGFDWIRLAEERDRWRAAVYAVMNLRALVPRI
jgi:hypothetical protein